MPIATPWTLDQYRAMRRDPASHPRRVVEYGQTLSGISTGVAMRHGFYPEGVLQPYIDSLGRFGLEEQEIDPDLEARVDDWMQLFTLYIIRDEMKQRLGHPASVAFDTFADTVHEFVHPGVPAFDKLDLDEQTPSWWFKRLDFALEHFQNWTPDPWDTTATAAGDDGADRIRAFVETVLFHDSRSPRHENTDPVETEEENRHHLQVALQVGWVEPLAIRLAPFHRKLTLRHLLGDGYSEFDPTDPPDWWPWPEGDFAT